MKYQWFLSSCNHVLHGKIASLVEKTKQPNKKKKQVIEENNQKKNEGDSH